MYGTEWNSFELYWREFFFSVSMLWNEFGESKMNVKKDAFTMQTQALAIALVQIEYE